MIYLTFCRFYIVKLTFWKLNIQISMFDVLYTILCVQFSMFLFLNFVFLTFPSLSSFKYLQFSANILILPISYKFCLARRIISFGEFPGLFSRCSQPGSGRNRPNSSQRSWRQFPDDLQSLYAKLAKYTSQNLQKSIIQFSK